MEEQADKYAETEASFSLRPVLPPTDDPVAPASSVHDDLTALWRKWNKGREEPGDQQPVDNSLTIPDIYEIFELDINAPINTDKMNAKLKELVLEAMEVLRAIGQQHLHSDHKASHMIRSILKKVEAARLILNGSYQWSLAETMRPSDLPDDAWGLWRFTTDDANTTLNSWQRLIMYAINDLTMMGYCRYKSYIVKNITTQINGCVYQTCAWQKVRTIEEYCMSLSGLRCSNNAVWLDATKTPGVKTLGKDLSEYIEKCHDNEVPAIHPDRHVFSFHNGVYMADKEIFVPYDRALSYFKSDYPTACNHFEMDFVADDVMFKDPYDIPTPSIETIFNTQKLSTNVRRWIYCFIGRLMYGPFYL